MVRVFQKIHFICNFKKDKSLLYTYTKIILVFKLKVCNIVNGFRYFGKNVLKMSSSKLTVLSDRCQKEK